MSMGFLGILEEFVMGRALSATELVRGTKRSSTPTSETSGSVTMGLSHAPPGAGRSRATLYSDDERLCIIRAWPSMFMLML